MKNYVLQKDETVLFRKNVQLLREGKKAGQYVATEAEVLLTNHHIIVSKNKRGMFTTTVETEVYDVHEVKVYDEEVQVIRERKRVDVYLNHAELFLEFEKEAMAKEFCDKAQKLISGFSKFVRAVKKTKKAIDETNEALDIDLVGAAKTAAAVAGDVTVAVAGKSKNPKTRVIGQVVDAVMRRKPKAELSERPPKTEADA